MSHHSCWRWRRRVTLLAAGVLEPVAAARTRAHLASCPRCRTAFAFDQRLTRRLVRWGEGLPDSLPPSRLREGWRAAIADAASPRPRAWMRWVRPGKGRAGLGPGWVGPGWAAVAGCWLLILVLRMTSPVVSGLPASTPQVPFRELLSLLQALPGEYHAPRRSV